MRTVAHWRDLPPVPRRAHIDTTTPIADHSRHRDAASTKPLTNPRRKRSRFSDLPDSLEPASHAHTPRKRPCVGRENHSPGSHSNTTFAGTDDDTSDGGAVRRVRQRTQVATPTSWNSRRRPVKTSLSASDGSQSTGPLSNASSKHSVSNSVSDSGTTPCDDAHDSSDEEVVRRGTRPRRRDVKSSSVNAEEHAPSSSLIPPQGNSSCSSSDHERHNVSLRESRKKRRADPPSDEKRAKRRRTRTPLESNSEKQHECRPALGSQSASTSMEPLSQDSSRESEPGMRPRKRSTYRAQRRRCARQSTTRSYGVPWYMLDEERTPYRLRSSSRNCAARCIFWTKTERRLFKVAKSPIHNRGLYALEDIPAFAPVIEYAGEVVTQVQSEIREWEYQSRHMDEVYMYQLRKGTTDVIDGTKRGGPAKFVNHSCEPNVIADEIQAGGTNRVWFFSLRPIRKHEEILVDYCLSYEPGDVKRPCMCGARRCKKYLNYCGLTD